MPKTQQRRTRNPEKTRARILEVAFMEIFTQGFQGANVNVIAAKAGLTKGALFHHFPTKEALGYAVVDETLAGMVRERWLRPLESHENPVLGIADNLGRIIDETAEEDLRLGCPLNNLVQEMSNVDPVFGHKLRDVLEQWISGVEGHLRRARKAGQLKEGVQPRRLAEFIVANHEGGFGIMKSMRDRRAFRSLQASLRAYLETLVA